ncbi:MAG: branched-chain amino acid aminotransferase [Deltaproteobacteria bacterium]|jgi:branched-chain amino acid aminotransferase|nr:branched-chain amino acid aminotransferase [Deltaproteobacteria bacterium]
MEILKRLQLPSHLKPLPTDEANLRFGDIYSDHMFLMDYFAGQWRNPRIEPFGPLVLSPAAMVLHYSQTIFEGLKCYRHPNGRLALFRPKDNFRRFNVSAERMSIPPLDETFLLAALKELLKIDGHWTPRHPEASLYIRPFVIATEPHLGVRPAKEYLFLIITGPVGPYYKEGFAPIKIYVESFYTRSAPGGLGGVKAGASYASSLLATEKAAQKGFTQLLWLDSVNHRFIEEVGSMNMFFVLDGKIVTSPLSSGTILPGITRASVLTVAQKLGVPAEERPLAIDELIEAIKSGRLTEAFGSGTAAVISPVGLLSYQEKDYQVADGQVGKITQSLYDELVGIQYGHKPDPYGWVELLD